MLIAHHATITASSDIHFRRRDANEYGSTMYQRTFRSKLAPCPDNLELATRPVADHRDLVLPLRLTADLHIAREEDRARNTRTY